jgi:hypothetical protein
MAALVLASPAFADDPAQAPPPSSLRVATLKFFAGAAVGLVIHEGGHVVLDLAFDAHPSIVPVHLGPAPFFAITHRGGLSPRREYLIDAAGFWMQGIGAERLFSTHPHLREESAWFTKGEFAFDEVTAVGYGVVALARTGPVQRDTFGMSRSSGVPEPIIGGLVLAPALLDGYRYFRPESRWATWASRVAKASTVLLLLK